MVANDIREWSGETGASWAAEWRRTDRAFTNLTRRLLERIGEAGFGEAVDIGCGAGELSLALARADPRAGVTGVDVSADLVEAARFRAREAKLANARFVLADAAKWRPVDEPAPDLLVSRHGVMFFEQPADAFANFAGFAAPGARLVFSCFRALALNPFFTELAALLPPAAPPDPDAPSPFAFADRDKVERLLAAAGWGDLAFEPVDFAMIAGEGDDPVAEALAFWTTIGPAALGASEMEPEERARFEDALRSLARRHCRDGIVSLPAAAWIVTARAP